MAQDYKKNKGDTSVSFKVSGVCIQCKTRIENSIINKYIKHASWNLDNQMLTVIYEAKHITVKNIQQLIVNTGHDVENNIAADNIYNALPACCHYRSKENTHEKIPAAPEPIPASVDTVITTPVNAIAITPVIKGVVLETNHKGVFNPLYGASVTWLKSGKGVATDSNGVFAIKQDTAETMLVISYAGYIADTIAGADNKDLKIILGSNKQLKEVTVISKQRSSYIAALNPIRTQIMTDKELYKAACCNLSESFETNPSVDVSYNDAVTGSKQIQLLGLSGYYTQITVENLPGPRGIAISSGLNAIAGPWVESIQLTKGIGSVANGYESIAGQINVDLKKPEKSEKIFANLYINDFGRTELNVNHATKVGKKWASGILVHSDFLNNTKLDFNKDGFRDLPTGKQFSAINRWKYDNSKGFLMQLGIKVLKDNRTGGEVTGSENKDSNSINKYIIGIDIKRYEAFAKLGYVFKEKQYKSIGLQLSATNHTQKAFFGLTKYDALQKSFYANLIYQSIIKTTVHKFRTGISFLHDNYDEDFKAVNYKRIENVPGTFFEYTYTPTEKISVITGLRADYNNLFGFFATPRLHLRYQPVTGTTLRFSGGRGQRTANIFAENTVALVSSRQVNIISAPGGKAYGLHAEAAWNKGISIDQKIKLFKRDALLAVDFFRNDFINQVVSDLEDVRAISFYNLKGKSYSNSVQAELNATPLIKLELRLAYRYFDVKTTYNGKLLQRPLVAAHRAFVNATYTIQGFKIDYTINYNGKKRIPSTTGNPAAFQKEKYSNPFFVMNTQLSKTVGKKYPVEIYLGAENLTNYFQKNVIIAAAEPFGKYFDAAMVWAPVTGRMLYAGFRFKIK